MVRGFWVVVISANVLAWAPGARGQSLGQIAREQREQREKSGVKPVMKFTNDTLPFKPTIVTHNGTASATANSSASKSNPAATGQKSAAGKMKTKAYWQEKFKAARAALASAKEYQSTSEDELHFLKVQRAQTLNPDLQNKLDNRIASKSQEVQENQATTAKAKAALAKLKDEFTASDAPADWAKTQ